MMDCQQAMKLLPLWVGQDLPDVTISREVQDHLKSCAACERYRLELQQSLDVLQLSTASTQYESSPRASVRSGVMTRISNWEEQRRNQRFNGWIPATVMGMAVALMVAVSLPSIRDLFSPDHQQTARRDDLFGSDPFSRIHDESSKSDPLNSDESKKNSSAGIPVNFKADQW